MGLLISIFTELAVAFGALVLLGSIVDLLRFPQIVMKNISNMHQKHIV